MDTYRLERARAFEVEAEKQISPEDRPSFHLSPRCGWLNDPNGFSYYKGQYHLFYQYYPYNSQWGPMHWGHAVSEDLLHWTYLPCAISPDAPYDRGGAFSGSAIVLPDGRHLLMYTGLNELQNVPGNDPWQFQNLAVGDGLNYTKYEGNPVLSPGDLPEGSDPHDFRDPKIWRREDGTYRAVAVGRASDGTGQVILFESPDAFHWKQKKILLKNDGVYGLMWECPDFFTLDGKGVLLISPMDMLPEGFEFHNGNGNLCLIGDYDDKEESFAPVSGQAIDSGIDFYATQTILAPDGRRIMISWMQNPDGCTYRGNSKPWYGQMTLPRELFIKDGRLWQRPVRELNAIRSNPVFLKKVPVEGECLLEGVGGRRIDLTVKVRPTDPEHPYHKFILRFAMNEEFYTQLSFRYKENVLKLDRKFSGTRRAVVNQRRCLVRQRKEELKLRVILDRYSVEVFINDGEQVMTALVYTDQEADQVMFYADGSAVIDVEKYDLTD